MFKRSSVHISAPIDATIALVVMAGALGWNGLHTSWHSFLLTRITGGDAVFGLLFLLVWQVCFSFLHLYDKFAVIRSRLSAVITGATLVTAFSLIYLKVWHLDLITFSLVLRVWFALIFYAGYRNLLSSQFLDRAAARNPTRAIIVGSGRRAGKAWRGIRTRYNASIQLLGFVDNRSCEEMSPDVARRYLGDLDYLSPFLRNNLVDMLIIAMPIRSCYPLMQRAVTIAEDAGVPVVYLGDIYHSRRAPARDLFSEMFRELAPVHEHHLVRLAVKRLVDIVGAVVGITLSLPLAPFIVIGIRLTSAGPVLYSQDRYGYRRRTFRMFKFRSMVADADARFASLAAANEASGPIFKIKDDPRVTSFGRFLRATSLDELPQFWNVLRGDMSLVGPRPMTLRDVSLFSEASLMRRFSVRPGITGLWQVSGRSSVGFERWVEIDNLYIDRWSLLLDLKILGQTFGALIKRSGAI